MYNTYDCARIGIFNIKEACKSFDITKDSKYLIAVATTFGVSIFNINDGTLINKIRFPGNKMRVIYVEFALGEK